MKHGLFRALTMVLMSVSIASCSGESDGPIDAKNLKKFEPIAFSRTEVDAVSRTQNFGWNLFKSVDNQESGNFLISPLSVVMNLSMLANGAEGETLRQILATLEIGGSDINTLNAYSKKLLEGIVAVDNSTELQIANALFVKPGINVYEDYHKELIHWYDADILQVGNGKSGQINQWIASKTKNRITNLISPEMEENAAFAVANALYFDAIWQSPFSESATIQDIFRAPNRYCKASFMCKKTKVEIRQNEEFAMARLNFGNGAFSIYFILPHEDVQLEDVVARLNEDLLTSLNTEYLNLNLRVPKFKMESQINLIEPIKECGIKNAFDAYSVDFSNLMDQNTSISFLRQGCVFSIDEKGVKAAAATVAGGDILAPPIEDNGDFFLDRPFLFLIKENSSNACLFMGKVEEV